MQPATLLVFATALACAVAPGCDGDDGPIWVDGAFVDVSDDAPAGGDSSGDGGVTDGTSDGAQPADAPGDGPTVDPDASTTDTGPGDVSGDEGTTPTDTGGSTDTSPDADRPLCGTIPTFEDGRTPSREIHVATTGSDDSGDGSPGAPFASVAHAAGLVGPGDAIRIHPGTYRRHTYFYRLRGTAEAPIWVGGVPGQERPVIDASGESQAFFFEQPYYVVVHDLVVRNAANNGINADDGSAFDDPEAARHVVFRDLLIEDVGPVGNQDCLKLSGLDDHFVLDSTFRRCGTGGSGVDHVGCHDGVIAGNTFEDLGSSGLQNKGGLTDIDVVRNRFLDAGMRPVNMGGSTGFQFFRPPVDPSGPNAEARRIRVLANLFVGGDTAAALVGCVDCVFAQNTVIDPAFWALRILQETVSGPDGEFLPTANGQVFNNIFILTRAGMVSDVNVGPDTDPDSFVFRNNLWYAHDAPERSAPSLPAPTSDDVVGRDPGLTDVYRIGPTSPAVGAGTTAPIAGDLHGRCFADPPSIGAWEGADD